VQICKKDLLKRLASGLSSLLNWIRRTEGKVDEAKKDVRVGSYSLWFLLQLKLNNKQFFWNWDLIGWQTFWGTFSRCPVFVVQCEITWMKLNSRLTCEGEDRHPSPTSVLTDQIYINGLWPSRWKLKKCVVLVCICTY